MRYRLIAIALAAWCIGTLPAAAQITVGSLPFSSAFCFTSGAVTICPGGITNAMLAGSIDLTAKVTGVLPVANGGTGISSLGAGVATFLGTPSSANLRAALTDESGTGLAYFQGGALGTPSSGTLTNATGLPVSTGVSGLAANIATFLGTPSSANLRAALIDGSGTGAAVFQGGDLGTPSAGVLTNATGLPISTGVSGLGSGVATFLGTPSSANLRSALTDETGTGLAYFQGGDLGTPSAGVLTNVTGLPISTGVSGLGSGVATFLGTPSSANLRSAVTDETGTGGGLVFATGPTLSAPTLTDAINQEYEVSTSDRTKTNDTTFEVVPGLEQALTAGKTYSCRGWLNGTSGASGGIKARFVSSGGLTATSARFTGQLWNGTTIVSVTTVTAIGSNFAGSNAVYTDLYVEGSIVVNAGGTIQFSMAQNTSNGTATTALTGSTLSCVRVN